jgi:hypothetical protein
VSTETVVAESVSVPGYRIVRPLGVGGMASVYLAVQESLDREVALKVMAPALAANQEFTQRFLKEGRITARLSHPNLVTVHDIGQHGSIYYLAAEFIPGGTLRDKMTKGISVAETLDAIRDIALGLQYAHEKGFVHRDVKPGNVLFRANGTAVLADFGIAKAVDSSTMATQAGSSIGTPHYMSPEQARAEPVDGRSDLYSLGAMLFELLAGHAPYEASDPFTIALMHVTHPLPVLPEKLKWLQPLIDKLMAKNASDRYANGNAFVEALDQMLANAPEARSVRAMMSERQRSAPRPHSGTSKSVAAVARGETGGGSKMPLYAGIGAAVAVLVGVGAWLLLRGPADPGQTTTTTTENTQATQQTEAVTQGEGESMSTPITTAQLDANDIPAVLARAQEYIKVGMLENGRRLASPDGDCAVDLLHHVLSLEPDNAEAAAALSQIASFFESKSKAAYDRGFYSGSMILAEQGLRADPTSSSLQKVLAESKQAAGL